MNFGVKSFVRVLMESEEDPNMAETVETLKTVFRLPFFVDQNFSETRWSQTRLSRGAEFIFVARVHITNSLHRLDLQLGVLQSRAQSVKDRTLRIERLL